MKIRNLFFSLLAAFVIVFSVTSCTMIGDETEENKSSFFTLAIRAKDSRSARSISTTYTPVDIVTNFTESQFKETVTKFIIKINNEPEITAAIGSAIESREEYPIGSFVTVSYTAYGNIRFSDASAVGAISSTTKEVVIASETQTVTVEAGGTNVYFNVKKGLKNADPYTVNTYDITYQPNSPDPSQSPSDIPGPQTDIKENTVAQISSQKPSISGYDFSYWLGNDGKRYNPGDQVTLTKDLILLAQWTSTGGASPSVPPAAEYDNLYVNGNGVDGSDSNTGTTSAPFATIGKAFEVISGYTTKQSVTINVSNTVKIDSTIRLTDGKTVNIQGTSSSPIIERASGFTGALFNVQQGTLQFDSITVDGKNEIAQSPLILVEGGRVQILSGTALQNNNNQSQDNNINGGAIGMTSGTLIIDSDTSIRITNNTAMYGGGIYATSGSVNLPNTSVVTRNVAISTEGNQVHLWRDVTYNGNLLNAEEKIE